MITNKHSHADKIFIFSLILCFIAASMEASICFPVLEEIQTYFNISKHKAQFMISINFVSLGIFGILVGYISDYFSPLKLLYFGIILLGISSLGCVMAHTINVLLLFRFLQGLSAAFPVVICSTIIVKIYPQDQSVRLLNFINSIVTICLMIAPLIGSIVMYFLGWRFVFIVTLLTCILGFIGTIYCSRKIEITVLPKKLSLEHLKKDIQYILQSRSYLLYGVSWAIVCSVLFIYFVNLPFIKVGNLNHNYMSNSIIQFLIMSFFVITSFIISKYVVASNIEYIVQIGWRFIFLASIIIIFCIFDFNFYLLNGAMIFFAIGNAYLIGVLSVKSISGLSGLEGTGTSLLQSTRYLIMTVATYITLNTNPYYNILIIILILSVLAFLAYILAKNNPRSLQER
ncbi:MFS transporter [Orientia tsutsugamushi]|uniref:MFS transporter n=1 Tax=Orientia tsutsugamushi TaxID=784 RepID=UPI000D5A53AB|nr:Bcr/CflA family drug resistance efflux transporter [Orientia tsutsugamushi]